MAKAQQFPIRFQHYTTHQGLSSDLLYDIAQDKNGWLWISTSAGLNKFNGSSFITYQHDEKNSSSLPSDKSRLRTDNEGTPWVYSDKGLHWFNSATADFIRLTGTENQTISAVGFDNSNAIWFCTADGWLWKSDSKTATPKKLVHFDGISLNALLHDTRNRLWIATDDGLFLYNKNNNTATKFKDELQGAGNSFFSIFEDSAGQLWVSSWGDGIKLFNPAEGSFSTYHFSNFKGNADIQNYAAAIIQPDAGKPELWVSTIDPALGIAVFNTAAHRFTQTINHSLQDPASLASNASICIFKDKSGIIWYASENGLDKYDPLANRFAAIELNQIPGCSADPGITSMAVINRQLWIGTSDKGIYVLDSSGQKRLHTINLSTTSGQAESNFIGSIHRITTEQTLICTYMGVFTCNTNTYKTKEILPFHSTNVSCAVRQQTTGEYWFATNDGLVRTDSSLRLIKDTLFKGITVKSLYQQKSGTIWIGTKGLYAWNSGKLLQINKAGEGYKKLNNSLVYDIKEDNLGNLLLATSSGAMVYAPGSQAISIFSKQNGLAHNACYAIVPGTGMQFWVLHEKGLAEINSIKGTVKNYQDAQGVNAPTFGDGLLYKSDAGQLYFGRYKSLYHFYPAQLKSNTFRAPVYITAIKLGDSLLPGTAWQQGGPLLLSYKNNSISIEFTMLNFSNSEGNTYEYKLEGSPQNEWTPAGTRNYITYPALLPGSYIFKVRGINSDGVKSNNEATVAFVVAPPWWQTTWFRFLAVLVLLTLLAAIVLASIASIKKKAAIRHQMLEAEVKALRAQMNPHFIFNCMNTIDSFILQSRKLEASQLVQRFSKLTRRVLEHTSQEYITLEAETETLRIYLQVEQMRSSNRFQFEIKTEAAASQWLIPPMLLQPFAENAVIHGIRNRQAPGAFINIDCVLEANQIKITIKDNGIGRAGAAEIKAAQPGAHRSLSMELTLGRLEALHGHKKHGSYLIFTDLTPPETGTKVDIFVPLIKLRNPASEV